MQRARIGMKLGAMDVTRPFAIPKHITACEECGKYVSANHDHGAFEQSKAYDRALAQETSTALDDLKFPWWMR